MVVPASLCNINMHNGSDFLLVAVISEDDFWGWYLLCVLLMSMLFDMLLLIPRLKLMLFSDVLLKFMIAIVAMTLVQ